MDQYVIQNVKLGYRKLLLTNILNDPVHNENLEKKLTNVNLKNVVFSLANCWASVSKLLINKSWKNLLPNFIDSEVEEIQLASLINQLQSTNPVSNTEALQWAAEADDILARNEILTGDEIIRTVTAEDDNDDDVTSVNPVKISHSEIVAALNTSLQWAEEQNFETQEILLLRRLRDRAFELKIGTAEQKNDDVHSLTYAVITKLSLITDEIESCSAQEFTISRQRDILGREAEIERLVHFIQKIFSVPSFLIATAHFSACTSIFGAFIVDSKIYTKDYVVLNQLVVVFLSSTGGLLACLWAAGGLPIEEDRFKDTFRRKTKQRLQLVINGANYANRKPITYGHFYLLELLLLPLSKQDPSQGQGNNSLVLTSSSGFAVSAFVRASLPSSNVSFQLSWPNTPNEFRMKLKIQTFDNMTPILIGFSYSRPLSVRRDLIFMEWSDSEYPALGPVHICELCRTNP
ncbi:hypothetical protein AVEN_199342-1 [Araneus ventricosus]|uniref:DDE-1 domain-containing protein n=1 Tax=Araneus ventricosus TaxID=182803 RepID=A0A4Y2JEP1_ARAVE|nr:hypothetical protein AVEN_199342-1 [Araneus ventricosus]